MSLNVSTIRYTVSARAKCVKNQKVGIGWRERGGRGVGLGETNYNNKKKKLKKSLQDYSGRFVGALGTPQTSSLGLRMMEDHPVTNS